MTPNFIAFISFLFAAWAGWFVYEGIVSYRLNDRPAVLVAGVCAFLGFGYALFGMAILYL